MSEEDENVRKTCSAQVYEIIITKNPNNKFKIICEPIHYKIFTFLLLDQQQLYMILILVRFLHHRLLVVFHKSLSDKSLVSMTLHSILADHNAVVCIVSIFSSSSLFWRLQLVLLSPSCSTVLCVSACVCSGKIQVFLYLIVFGFMP